MGPLLTAVGKQKDSAAAAAAAVDESIVESGAAALRGNHQAGAKLVAGAGAGAAAGALQAALSAGTGAAAPAALTVTTSFLDPSFAVGLLALAHASEVEVQKHIMLNGVASTDRHHHAALKSPSPSSLPVTARVNWSLLHQYPSAARTAAVWGEVSSCCVR